MEAALNICVYFYSPDTSQGEAAEADAAVLSG